MHTDNRHKLVVTKYILVLLVAGTIANPFSQVSLVLLPTILAGYYLHQVWPYTFFYSLYHAGN